MADSSPSPLASTLGRIPSGVFVLIAGDGAGKKTGMVASWVQQASFEPPQVTVAVNKTRYLNEWLTIGSPVTLNQIVKGDSSLFRHFGKGFGPDEEAFEGLPFAETPSGLPVLQAAGASMLGEVSNVMEAGDHSIYLVTLTDGRVHAETSEPYVHLRKNGLTY